MTKLMKNTMAARRKVDKLAITALQAVAVFGTEYIVAGVFQVQSIGAIILSMLIAAKISDVAAQRFMK